MITVTQNSDGTLTFSSDKPGIQLSIKQVSDATAIVSGNDTIGPVESRAQKALAVAQAKIDQARADLA